MGCSAMQNVAGQDWSWKAIWYKITMSAGQYSMVVGTAQYTCTHMYTRTHTHTHTHTRTHSVLCESPLSPPWRKRKKSQEQRNKVHQKRFAVTKFLGIVWKQCRMHSQAIGTENSSTHVPLVSNLVFYAQSNIMVISGWCVFGMITERNAQRERERQRQREKGGERGRDER